MRNTLDAVDIRRDLLGIDNLVPFDTEFLGSLDRIVHLVPYSDAEDIEVITMELGIYVLDIRNLGTAWTAP